MQTLSVIVPVYNEGPLLKELLPFLMRSPCPINREWIFVDDGSSDGSLEILRNGAEAYGYKLLMQPTRSGKGAAVIRAIQEASGDFIVIQDADREYDPADIPMLLGPLLEGKADVVYGSRFKKDGNQVHRTYHYLINRALTTASNLLSGCYLTDMETCYKVFRADLLKSMRLESPHFGIEVELTAKVAKVRARVYEFPISYYPRTRLQGKKIGWRDGVAALGHLVRYNLLTTVEESFTHVDERYRG
ncbi:MAG: glycosyltransferase family 2 protein [Polyangiaceae bacterium]|nr:glycosyltransferase family 2 protein [Polyangiaceae bacterium]